MKEETELADLISSETSLGCADFQHPSAPVHHSKVRGWWIWFGSHASNKERVPEKAVTKGGDGRWVAKIHFFTVNGQVATEKRIIMKTIQSHTFLLWKVTFHEIIMNISIKRHFKKKLHSVQQCSYLFCPESNKKMIGKRHCTFLWLWDKERLNYCILWYLFKLASMR